jgi:hypothetical protein
VEKLYLLKTCRRRHKKLAIKKWKFKKYLKLSGGDLKNENLEAEI